MTHDDTSRRTTGTTFGLTATTTTLLFSTVNRLFVVTLIPNVFEKKGDRDRKRDSRLGLPQMALYGGERFTLISSIDWGVGALAVMRSFATIPKIFV